MKTSDGGTKQRPAEEPTADEPVGALRPRTSPTADLRGRREGGLIDRRHYRSFLIALSVLVAVAVLLGVMVGSVRIPATVVLRVIGSHLGLVDGGAVDPAIDQVVWDLRLPRALLGAVVGSGLAIAGAVIQVAVRNPLGDPYLLGVMAGASTGAVFIIVLGSPVAGLGVSGAAFAGALLATGATFVLGRRGSQLPATRVVLAGVAIAYLFSAITFYLQSIATPNELKRAVFWGFGSIAGAAWSDLGVPALTVAAMLVVLLSQGRNLNALLAGDEVAASLGVRVIRLQIGLLVVGSLLSAVVVAVAGGIGFVGLVVPHVARLLVGSDHRRVLPVTFLLGAAFIVVMDLVARTVVRPSELPLSIVTAAVGAPFFLWLLRRNRSGSW